MPGLSCELFGCGSGEMRMPTRRGQLAPLLLTVAHTPLAYSFCLHPLCTAVYIRYSSCMANTRDAFDDWQASEPSALHNLTIAEIWMAAYDAGVADERERIEQAEADLWDMTKPAAGSRLTDA